MTNDVSGAVKAAKSGRVDFKLDKTAIVHVGLGKVWDISTNANMPSVLINVMVYISEQLICCNSVPCLIIVCVVFAGEFFRGEFT